MNLRDFIRLRRPHLDERGVAMMEYALLASGIVVVAIGAVSFLGQNAALSFEKTETAFAAAGIYPGVGTH